MSSENVRRTLPPEKEHLVTDNLRLVDHVLHKYMHITSSDPYYYDYQSEGYLGLIKAAIDYDESYGTLFSTYAVSCIYGYARRMRRDFVHSPLKVPRSLIDNYARIVSLITDGKSYEEISEELGISIKDIQESLACRGVESLDREIDGDDSRTTISDLIGFEDTSFEDMESETEFLNAIEVVASRLSDRDRNVWYDYIYPMYFGEHVPETALAAKYNISQPQISRILRRIKAKFAKEIGFTGDTPKRRGRPRKL